MKFSNEKFIKLLNSFTFINQCNLWNTQVHKIYEFYLSLRWARNEPTIMETRTNS